jgi:hypothetical protein
MTAEGRSRTADEIRDHVEAARHQALAEAVQIAQTIRDDTWAAVCADTDDPRSWAEMDGVCKVENALRDLAGLPLDTSADASLCPKCGDARHDGWGCAFCKDTGPCALSDDASSPTAPRGDSEGSS